MNSSEKRGSGEDIIRWIRQMVLLLPTLLILFIPFIIYKLLSDRFYRYRSIFYRRDFPALVSLDVALAQHSGVLGNYLLVGLLILMVGKLCGIDILKSFFSWVTLSPIGRQDVHGIFSIILGGYGMFGIALLAGLIISTYVEINSLFPRHDDEIKEYWNRIFEIRNTPVTINTVIIAVTDAYKRIVMREEIARPTLHFLWKRVTKLNEKHVYH